MRRSALLLLLLALVASACGPTSVGPRTAATINGDVITVAEVEPLIAAGQQGADPATGQPPAEQDAAVQAISNLALVTLATQQIEELGGDPVTDAEVDAAVEEAMAAAGGQEAFEQQLAAQGLDIEAVRGEQRFQMVIQRLSELLGADVEVTDAQVQEVYDAQYALPEVSHILLPTEEEAQAALDRIEGGEDFAAVAQEVSTDPGSGAQGGFLGPLTPGQFIPEFEEAALALEPGAISDPVETQFGFHLITTSAPPDVEEVRDQISDGLTQQQVQGRLTDVVFAALLDADAEVNPRFGVWDPEVDEAGNLVSIVVPTDPLGDLVPVTADIGTDGQQPAPTAPPVEQ